jgi:hypothetical protein
MADDENEYISVVQAVKLIPNSFDGNPKQLREFCEGVEAARLVVHPTKHPLLLKFIESKITGEDKDRLRRTLEYYAGVLFTSKQGVSETVEQWGSRIDNMGIDLKREALADLTTSGATTIPGGSEGGIFFRKHRSNW